MTVLTRKPGDAVPKRESSHLDTLSLQVDELNQWIESPQHPKPSEQWALAAGELLLNCGALEQMIDGLIAHYSPAPRPGDFYRKPWAIRRAHLVEIVRAAETWLARRAALIEALRQLDEVLECRTRLAIGRPRLTRPASLPQPVDDEAFIELTHWAASGPQLHRLDYRELADAALKSRELMYTLERIWAELPPRQGPTG